MKVSVTIYSFMQLISSGKKTPLECIGIAKEMGFDAIEFVDLCPENGLTQLEYAEILREESEKAGLPIVNYTIGADFLNCEDFNKEVERLCAQVDIAKILGAKGMRHDATVGYKSEEKAYKGFNEALPVLADGCRQVTEYAKTQGIVTMVENHGFFCQESSRVERLVGAVGNPNFGWLVDVGNFLCGDDDPATAVGRAAAMAKYVHVKDFHIKSGSETDPGKGFFTTRGGTYLRGAILGHGNVPVYQCLKTLNRNGYDGFVSVEFEGMEDNIPALEICLENLRNIINRL